GPPFGFRFLGLQPGCPGTYVVSRLDALRPSTRKRRNRTANTSAKTLAMANEAPAMPVKPRRAATSPTRKKTRASFSIVAPPEGHNCESHARAGRPTQVWRGIGISGCHETRQAL